MLRAVLLVFAIALALVLPDRAPAQSWPGLETYYMSDYAGVIDDPAEARITDTLATLYRDTGAWVSVITLPTREGYPPAAGTIAFASGLFDAWDLGDDGVLVLILIAEREMRVTLGRAYGTDWDNVSQDIVDTAFVPAFRAGDFSGGTVAGVEALAERVVRARATPEDTAPGFPPKTPGRVGAAAAE